MTPGQLSPTIVDVLEALVADGSVTLPHGVPTTVTVERPRQKGHGDYATNVALQLAKQAGHQPAGPRRARERPPGGRRGHRRRRGRRPGLPQHHRRGGGAGPGRCRDRGGRGGVRLLRRLRRREDQPRVRLRQPDRPAAPRRRPLGRRRRRAGPGLQPDRRRGHPGVLLQRPRRPDRPVQLLAAGLGAGTAGARGRLRRRLHRRDRQATSSPSGPEVLDLPDARARRRSSATRASR